MYFKIACVCFFVIFVIEANGQYEGDKCYKNNVQGVCTIIDKCQSAIDGIRRKIEPQLCSFINTDPVVCCVDSRKEEKTTTTVPPPVATTPKRPRTTTQYVPPIYDYVFNDGSSVNDACELIFPNMTATKNGNKAWDKCIEYQHRLVYPCKTTVALLATKGRENKCNHDAIDLIVGGVGAGLKEFPDMVLLGFGQDINTAQWMCGGTLISERFILTAGHCTSSGRAGPVTFARIGALKRTDPIDVERLYRIKNIIKNPNYKSPDQYNDIALLETDREILLDEHAIPACLDVGAPNDYERVLATGWGATQNRGATADQLQKVILHKFTSSECSAMFRPQRLMKRGFDPNTQICYGDKHESKDTCQGDSGGPIVLKHKQINCMYTVIGVTSVGRVCGAVGEPGIYTRVSAFVPWIESVVWPD